MVLYEHLLILRESHGLKQKDIAEEIGIGLHTYQRYEYGHREPPLATLIALADYYDMSLDELVCREWEPKGLLKATNSVQPQE